MKLKVLVTLIAVFSLVHLPRAQSADIMNAAASAAVGTYMVSTVKNMNDGEKWSKKCSGAWGYCIMAVMAFAQAAQALKGASDSGKTVSATDCIGAYCSGNGVGYNGGSNPYNPGGGQGLLPNGGHDAIAGGTLPGGAKDIIGGDLRKIQNDLNKEIDKLADKGYSYDENANAINTPKGAIAASTLGTEAGLRSLGFTDSDIADLKASAAKDLKAASRFSGGDLGGGGGSPLAPGRGYDSEPEEGFDMNKYLSNLRNKKIVDANRGVAGLEKKFGSDQIGVAQDDIFKMIHRRYEAKKSTLNP